jgi:acyl-CoA thioester hydrolase
MKVWKSTLTVRSYELDSFGHVNNGTYPHYLEAARCDYLKEAGIHFDDFRKWKKFPVIAKVTIEYKAPAYYQEVLHIDAIVKNLGKSSCVYEYKITKDDGTLVANAETLMVFVNEHGKPCYMPEKVREEFSKT